jgi:hypothetical protein
MEGPTGQWRRRRVLCHACDTKDVGSHRSDGDEERYRRVPHDGHVRCKLLGPTCSMEMDKGVIGSHRSGGEGSHRPVEMEKGSTSYACRLGDGECSGGRDVASGIDALAIDGNALCAPLAPPIRA